jgi:uncharacterized membrane protein (DUF2068 family)
MQGGSAVDNTLVRFKTTGVLVTTSATPRDSGAPAGEHHPPIKPRDTGLYLIGIFKLVKAVFFLGVSLGALHFVHHDLSGTVDRMIRELHFDPESRIVDLVTDKVALITHHKLRLISLGTFLYSGLCTTEAYGLLRRKVWAEFVTLWLSVSFIPWELWELARRPTFWHVAILLANLVIVAYLVWMLQRKKKKTRQAFQSDPDLQAN